MTGNESSNQGSGNPDNSSPGNANPGINTGSGNQENGKQDDGNHVVINSHFLARLLSRGGEAELLSAADRLDIMDLVHTFGWCVDAHSYDVLANIITEDFVMDMATEKVEGRTKFIDFLKGGKHFEGLRHQNANILMRSIDLTNAVAVTYLNLVKVGAAEGKDEGVPSIVVQAVCTDVLKSEKDIWKLAKRTIDQMAVSSTFVTDAGAREKFAMTAKDRRAAAKPVSK